MVVFDKKGIMTSDYNKNKSDFGPNFLPDDDELLRREKQWIKFFKNLEMAEESNPELVLDDFDESHSSNQEDENSSDAMSVQSCEDDKENFDMQQVVAEMQPVIDRRVADWPAKGVNLQLKKVDPKVTVREWLRANAEWTTTKEKYKKTVVEENNKKVSTTVKRTITKTFQSFGFPKVRSCQVHDDAQPTMNMLLEQPNTNRPLSSSTKKKSNDVSPSSKTKKSEFAKKFSFKKPQSVPSAITEKPKKQTKLMNSSSALQRNTHQQNKIQKNVSERHHQRRKLRRPGKQATSTITRTRNDKVRVKGENIKSRPGKRLQSVCESETDDELEDCIFTTKPPPLRIVRRSNRIQGNNKTILQWNIPSKGASQYQNTTASMLVDSEDCNSEDEDVLMTSFRYSLVSDKLIC